MSLFEADCRYCLMKHEITGRHVVAFSGTRAKGWQNENLTIPTLLVEKSVLRLLDVWGDARLFVKVGDATGVDALVREACGAFGVCYEVLIAHWKGHGSFAGHERNGRVIEGADELIAISRPGQYPSAGTGNAIYQAEKAGILVHEWRTKWLR